MSRCVSGQRRAESEAQLGSLGCQTSSSRRSVACLHCLARAISDWFMVVSSCFNNSSAPPRSNSRSPRTKATLASAEVRPMLSFVLCVFSHLTDHFNLPSDHWKPSSKHEDKPASRSNSVPSTAATQSLLTPHSNGSVASITRDAGSFRCKRLLPGHRTASDDAYPAAKRSSSITGARSWPRASCLH